MGSKTAIGTPVIHCGSEADNALLEPVHLVNSENCMDKYTKWALYLLPLYIAAKQHALATAIIFRNCHSGQTMFSGIDSIDIVTDTLQGFRDCVYFRPSDSIMVWKRVV